MACRQPLEVVCGYNYTIQQTVYTQHCVVERLSSTADSLLANGFARLDKHKSQCRHKDNCSDKHYQQAKPPG